MTTETSSAYGGSSESTRARFSLKYSEQTV
jgi:hypothetical protein